MSLYFKAKILLFLLISSNWSPLHGMEKKYISHITQSSEVYQEQREFLSPSIVLIPEILLRLAEHNPYILSITIKETESSLIITSKYQYRTSVNKSMLPRESSTISHLNSLFKK